MITYESQSQRTVDADAEGVRQALYRKLDIPVKTHQKNKVIDQGKRDFRRFFSRDIDIVTGALGELDSDEKECYENSSQKEDLDIREYAVDVIKETKIEYTADHAKRIGGFIEGNRKLAETIAHKLTATPSGQLLVSETARAVVEKLTQIPKSKNDGPMNEAAPVFSPLEKKSLDAAFRAWLLTQPAVLGKFVDALEENEGLVLTVQDLEKFLDDLEDESILLPDLKRFRALANRVKWSFLGVLGSEGLPTQKGLESALKKIRSTETADQPIMLTDTTALKKARRLSGSDQRIRKYGYALLALDRMSTRAKGYVLELGKGPQSRDLDNAQIIDTCIAIKLEIESFIRELNLLDTTQGGTSSAEYQVKKIVDAKLTSLQQRADIAIDAIVSAQVDDLNESRIQQALRGIFSVHLLGEWIGSDIYEKKVEELLSSEHFRKLCALPAEIARETNERQQTLQQAVAAAIRQAAGQGRPFTEAEIFAAIEASIAQTGHVDSEMLERLGMPEDLVQPPSTLEYSAIPEKAKITGSTLV